MPDAGWPDDAARRLVAEARREAAEDVRAVLRRRFAGELLEAAETLLAESAPAPKNGTGLWLYGVADGGAPDPAADLRGVDATAVRAIRHGGLTAFAGDVPLARFGADVLPAQLEDLERVEALARAHEAVVDRLLADTTVVPCRLCTIYGSEDSLRAMLAREAASLGATLERLRGATEWGVKVIAEATAAAPRQPELATGADYIAAKREARAHAERRRDALDAVAGEVHARLTEHADGAVLGRPQDPQLSGHRGEMLLNGAYLVPDPRRDEFRTVVEELAQRHAGDGVVLELTGPWPPYHFAGEVPQA